MRQSKAAKLESHDRIVKEASAAFLSQGLEKAGVAEVMRAAGLTHGGFYRHFASKDELLAEAIAAAFEGIAARFDQRSAEQGPKAAAVTYRQEYLSDEHVANPGKGCPVAAIAAEAARLGEVTSRPFSDGVEALIGRIAAAEDAEGEIQSRRKAIQELTALVGTVIVARAVGEGPLREEILASQRCRNAVSGAS